jgi:hypothetical protein
MDELPVVDAGRVSKMRWNGHPENRLSAAIRDRVTLTSAFD